MDPSAFQTGVSLPSLPADQAAALEFGVIKKMQGHAGTRTFGLSKAVAGGGEPLLDCCTVTNESMVPTTTTSTCASLLHCLLVQILDSGHGQMARPSMAFLFSKESSLVFAPWQISCLCLLCSLWLVKIPNRGFKWLNHFVQISCRS